MQSQLQEATTPSPSYTSLQPKARKTWTNTFTRLVT